MFKEATGVGDSVEMSVTNKTPEEIAYRKTPEFEELKRRMAQVPQQWYALAGGVAEIKPCEWMEYFRRGSWIKLVYDSDLSVYGVFFGQVAGLCGTDTLQIEPNTALFDNKIHDTWLDHSTVKLDGEGVVHVFTSDKFMADKVREQRG